MLQRLEGTGMGPGAHLAGVGDQSSRLRCHWSEMSTNQLGRKGNAEPGLPLAAAGHLKAEQTPHRMTRHWAAGGDHSLMQSTVVHVHITGMMHIHHLRLMLINVLLNVLDQIEAVQRIETIVRKIKELNPCSPRIDPAICAAWAKVESSSPA